MSLRGDAQVLHPSGESTAIPHLHPGDPVLAYDFRDHDFRTAHVLTSFDAGIRMVHRFRHDFGILECTLAHKVCVLCENGKQEFIRARRAAQDQRPVVVRTPRGAPAFALLEYMGEIMEEPIWGITIDHPDHAFICDNIAISEG